MKYWKRATITKFNYTRKKDRDGERKEREKERKKERKERKREKEREEGSKNCSSKINALAICYV